MKRIITFLMLWSFYTSNAQPISITNSSFSYSQDFNFLATTGTANTIAASTGWIILEKGTSTRNNAGYAGDNGASNSGDCYSIGATGNSERALGSLRSGTLSPLYGVGFVNNSSSAITSITVSYKGETWRVGATNREDSIKFEYAIGATGIDTIEGSWIRVTELDYIKPGQAATATAGGSEIHSATLSRTISGINIPIGSTIYFRFNDTNAAGSDDMTGIDDFSISMTAIPVELVDFKAQKGNSKVNLEWQTATELNNAYYEIERSSEGKTFEKIGEISGYGNSNVTRTYSFIDEKPNTDVNYYRLRQVDFDGKATVSKTVSVNFGKNTTVKVYPNIAKDQINVELNSENGTSDLFVVNQLGQVVKSQKLQNTEGVRTLNISDLPNGFYFINIVSKNGNVTQRFEKQ